MAAEAAARCGAGLISIAMRPEYAPMQAALRPELMFRGVATPSELSPLIQRANVLAIGPGLGTDAWAQDLLDNALNCGLPLVVDADALNLLAEHPQQRDDWILTPHPGEASRLLGQSIAEIQADRFTAAQHLVSEYGRRGGAQRRGLTDCLRRSTPADLRIGQSRYGQRRNG